MRAEGKTADTRTPLAISRSQIGSRCDIGVGWLKLIAHDSASLVVGVVGGEVISGAPFRPQAGRSDDEQQSGDDPRTTKDVFSGPDSPGVPFGTGACNCQNAGLTRSARHDR